MSILHRLIFLANLLAAVGMGLSLLAAYVGPESIWWLTLFGLGFEILLVINIAFMIYWIILRNKKFLLSFFVVIISLGKIFGIVQFHPFVKDDKSLKKEGYFKVMSFNVRLFDLYNWFHNEQTRGQIFRFLSDESPDIICFQEYYSSDDPKNRFRNDDTLKRVMQTRYAQIEHTVTLRNADHWGIATYSRFPIIRKRAHHFNKKGGSIFMYADIKVGTDTIRVFNAHLESVRFGWKDYRFIENLNNDNVEQDEIAGGKRILQRLKKAFVLRAQQIRVMKDSVDASPYPVIVCGDFNDTPSSFTYEHISEGLSDAFRVSGNGLGKTYTGPFPSFRIDYIFHDRRLHSEGYQTVKEKLSDHYPIYCWMKK